MPTLLSRGVTQSLQQYGLTNITVQVSEVGLSQASIEQFDVTYPDGDTTLRIQLNNVKLDYTLSQLISGQAENLTVGSLALTLDQQASEDAGPSPTLPTIEQLLEAYSAVDASSFPLGALELPSISISHNLASDSGSTFDVIELQAEVTKHTNQLNAQVLFANQQQLDWASDQSTGWKVEFFDTPTSGTSRQPAFKGSLNRVGQSLVFSADIKPRLQQPTAQQTENSLTLSEVSFNGTIKGNNPLPGLAVLSTIEIQGLDYQELNIQTINGEFDIQVAQVLPTLDQSEAGWQLNVESNSTLSLTGASFTDWQADKLTLNVISDVSLTENVSKINSPEFLLTVGTLQYADELELGDTSFTGSVSALIDAEQWQVDVAESWQLTSQYARRDEIELPQGFGVSSTQPLQLNGALQTDTLALQETLLEVTVPVVQDTTSMQRFRPHKPSVQIEQAQFNQGQLVATGVLAIPELTIDDSATDNEQQNEWRLDNVSQTFELKNDLLTSRGSVQSTERDLHIDITSKHDFEQRKGSSEFRFKTLTFNDPERFNKLVSPIEQPVSLVTGEVDLSGQVSWLDKADEWQVAIDIDAQLKNLGGAYEEVYFSGAEGQFSLQVYPEIVSKTPQKLNVAHIDAGVENKQVVVEFQLRPSSFGDLPVVDILQAQTQLLQGSIELTPIKYDLNKSEQNLQIVLEKIDLNELVTLQQLDDVQATGLISGLLPIKIKNEEISIDDGKLQAIAPGGVLRYQADTDALLSNQYAETVVLALRDFHYNVLNADTQYKPDGTLTLELQLKGNNPAFEQGRQINLNINLEQNVLKLLESLRLYDGVSDKLDKRVRDFYQQTK